jgi:ATP-binding cassette subfamily G (WHITE) protein 2
MFMCKGQCVYHGVNNDVVPYFSTLGYQCETHENPTDFVLDILIDAGRTPETLARLIDAYEESAMHTDLVALGESRNSLADIENSERLQRKIEVEAAQSLRTEIFYVSQRTLRNAVRNPAMALAQVTVSIMIGFLVGLVFYDMKKTIDPGVQNRLGTIFFIVVNQVFSTMTAIEPLIQERALFLHVIASCITKIIDRFFIFSGICEWLLPNPNLFHRKTDVRPITFACGTSNFIFYHRLLYDGFKSNWWTVLYFSGNNLHG